MPIPRPAHRIQAPRIGLRRESLGYSLHENIKPSASTDDAAIFAPPKSDSEDELLSAAAPSPLDGTGDDEFSIQRSAKRRKPNEPMSSIHVVGTRKPSSSDPALKRAESSDDDPAWARLSSSQGSRGRAKTYGGANVARSSAGDSAALKTPTISTLPAKKGKGFRAPGAIPAARRGSNGQQANTGSAFKKPVFTKTGNLSSDEREPGSKFKRPTRSKARGQFLQAVPETRTAFRRPTGKHLAKALELETELPTMPSFRHPPASSKSSASHGQSSDSTLSSISLDSDDEAELSQSFDEIAAAPLPSSAQKVPCPICRSPIPRSVFDGFIDAQGGNTRISRRLNVRQQTRFCRSHRDRSATGVWKMRGYPDIDWDALAGRVEGMQDGIERILAGADASFYRARAEERADGRKRTTVLESGADDGGEDVGYYGSRGARKIADKLVALFSTQLGRKLAAGELTAAGGIVGFVHAVLLPEVVMRLVREDMAVDDAGARSVMAQSAEQGRLLCEEEDETIVWEEGDLDGEGR